MFELKFCFGFLFGCLTAGVFGHIFQRRLLLLRTRAGQAPKKVAVVEAKQSPPGARATPAGNLNWIICQLPLLRSFVPST